MGKEYVRPTLPEGTHVARIQASDRPQHVLLADTIVTCLNRGRQTQTVQFDGQHFDLPPGYFEARFDQAQHFKSRLIVPGTRDREQHERMVSYIAIVGYDKPELCEPFTTEQLERFGESVEGLDRSTMALREDREVTVVQTKQVAGRIEGRRQGRATRVSDLANADQATDEAAERAGAALTPPAATDAEREEAEAKPARRRGRK